MTSFSSCLSILKPIGNSVCRFFRRIKNLFISTPHIAIISSSSSSTPISIPIPDYQQLYKEPNDDHMCIILSASTDASMEVERKILSLFHCPTYSGLSHQQISTLNEVIHQRTNIVLKDLKTDVRYFTYNWFGLNGISAKIDDLQPWMIENTKIAKREQIVYLSYLLQSHEVMFMIINYYLDYYKIGTFYRSPHYSNYGIIDYSQADYEFAMYMCNREAFHLVAGYQNRVEISAIADLKVDFRRWKFEFFPSKEESCMKLKEMGLPQDHIRTIYQN